jgi:hypothetical protein
MDRNIGRALDRNVGGWWKCGWRGMGLEVGRGLDRNVQTGTWIEMWGGMVEMRGGMVEIWGGGGWVEIWGMDRNMGGDG